MDPRSQHIMVSSSLNAALCALKTKDYAACVRYASVAIYLEPENIKALFRRGKGNTGLAEYKRAREDLTKAKELDPGNKDVLKAFYALADKKLEDKGKAKKKFGGAFDRVSMYTDKDGVEVIQRKKEANKAKQKQAAEAEAAKAAKAKAAEVAKSKAAELKMAEKRKQRKQEHQLAVARNSDWKYVVGFYVIVGGVFALRFGLGFRFFGFFDLVGKAMQ
jgi:tetratricopeptide (TPR) repeat protein